MMRTFIRIFAVSLLVMAAVPSFGQSGNDGKSGVVLGSEIMPKDTTKARRFTNHLIAPKGGWQCGLTVVMCMICAATMTREEKRTMVNEDLSR